MSTTTVDAENRDYEHRENALRKRRSPIMRAACGDSYLIIDPDKCIVGGGGGGDGFSMSLDDVAEWVQS